ncbi:membrane-spanning 4-domains subfamily A member 10 [Notamacropus eugenii]|uniref:membrane-spanning 4-domains subfamily A member 10 n=1 Tax=Notamacropus eugenii TaxID=9315 RepID=UPI003B683D43
MDNDKENMYIVTGEGRGLVVPAGMTSPEEKAPGQNRLEESPSSGFFLQEDRHRGIWRKAGPLTELGAFQIVNALIHIIIGIYLAVAVKNLHLVVMKCWYPFWGAFFFLCSGTLLITMERGRKMKLKTWAVVASIMDCFCTLCGIFVFVKDLFWESPFEFPIWRPYPSSIVHLQRVELGLLIFSSLEFFSFICAMILLCRTEWSSEVMDDFSTGTLPLEYPVNPAVPPPTYEEVIFNDKKEETNP